MKQTLRWNLAWAVLALVGSQAAVAFDGLVTKRTFEMHAMEVLRKQGVPVETVEIEGDGGHLGGVVGIAKAVKALRDFLAR